MKYSRFILSVLMMFFFGCATSPAPVKTQDIKSAYKIGPNDVINLSIFAGGKIQHNEDITVSSQGTINTPFIGIITAEGLTPSELEKAIESPLGKDYFVDPKVNINIKLSKLKIYVEGEVKSPNAYDYEPGMTALKACIIAGGFTTFAAPNRTKIIRQKGEEIEVIKTNLNDVKDGEIPDVEVFPGDRINVPESWL